MTRHYLAIGVCACLASFALGASLAWNAETKYREREIARVTARCEKQMREAVEYVWDIERSNRCELGLRARTE